MVMHEKNAKKLKGATLYTVTLVISVMLILMLTAIAMSGAAYRRASSEFRADQTTSTARSVVTTILESLQKQAASTDETLAKNLSEGLKNLNDTVTLNVAGDSGSNTIPGFGTIESVTFTNIGKDDETGYFITGSGENIIKVTATVSYGYDKTNVTTYTQYVTNAISTDAQAGGSGGFIASGGVTLPTSTGAKFFGESYTGIDPNAVPNVAVFRNPAVLEGGAMFNSSMYCTTSNSRIELTAVNGKDNGVYITGSLGFLNDSFINVAYDHSSVHSTSDLPYVYVEGTFLAQNKLQMKNSDDGINLFTGRFVTGQQQPIQIKANLFCYNTDSGYSSITDANELKTYLSSGRLGTLNENSVNSAADIDSLFNPTSGISIIESNGSSLLDWASGITTGTNNGSLYSRGSVMLVGDNKVADLVVGGALLIECGAYDPKVTGNIYADTVCIIENEAGHSLDVSGNIYCNNVIAVPAHLNDKIQPLEAEITAYFPQGMSSREDISGANPDHPEYKIIKTKQEAADKFYDKGQGKYKMSENVSHLNISSGTKIYYQNGSNIMCTTPDGTTTDIGKNDTFEIGESCTLAGNFSEKIINIKPSGGEKLWINLFCTNFEFCKIIVDDSDGKVNFFIPMKDNYCQEATSISSKTDYINKVNDILSTDYDGTNNFLSCNGTSILTKRYYKDFLGGDNTKNQRTFNLSPIHLKTFYTEEEEIKENYVPDINIYAADNVYTDDKKTTHLSPRIDFINECAVTGNLIAAYSTFSFKKGAITQNNNMNYIVSGSDTKSNMDNVNEISWIGSVLVGAIEEMQNDFAFFYVSRSGNNSNPGLNGNKFNWDLIDGFATY